MNELNLSMNSITLTIEEDENVCKIINEMLSKPEKEWSEFERQKYVSKNALREQEASIETKLHELREERNKLMTQKLYLLESMEKKNDKSSRSFSNSSSLNIPSVLYKRLSFSDATKEIFGTDQALRKSKEIDKALSNEYIRKKKERKDNFTMILIGPADSGKSTFLKQLILILQKGFTSEDRKSYCTLIRRNIINSVLLLISELDKSGLNVDESRQKYLKVVVSYNQASGVQDLEGFISIQKAIQCLLEDKNIIKILNRSNEIHLQDCIN